MNKHSAIRNFRTTKYAECYACGLPRDTRALRPFGRNVFDEPVTWVCDHCVEDAHVANPNVNDRLPRVGAFA